MAAKNEAKIKFTADTQQFTQGINNARTNMASLRAAMALSAAEFKNTGDKAEMLKNKQQLLNNLIQQSQSIQQNLNNKLEAAKRYYGEDSQEVQKLQTAITREQTAEQRLQTQLNETNEAIKDQAAAEKALESPLGQLTSKIEKQEKELAKLKTEYANVVLSEGKNSAAANDLRAKIDSLNIELNENKQKLKDATLATKDMSNAQQNANSGWTMAKGIVSNLATQGLHILIQKMKEAAKAVISLGSDFTSSLSKVEALSGATGSQMDMLSERAQELGRSTMFTATNVSDAFGYMALAGWDTTQMLDGIDGVLNLAAASGMDLAQASDMVTDYLTAFGLEASDASQMVDMLTYAQANSNTSTEQLGQAFGNSASSMHTAGQTMETTTAILEALANQSIKGSEAGTALSAITRDITQKMEDGKIMIGDTAVTVQDASGNFRNLIDILADVEAATDGMGSAEKSAALMTTFTARSYKAVGAVLTEGTDNIKQYEAALQDCTGTASEMTEVMNDNLKGDLKELGSAAQGLGLQLFEYFEGPLRGAAQIATDAINAVTDAIKPQLTDLKSFTQEIQNSNNEVEKTLKNAQSIMSGGESNLAELEYYKNLLLDLNEKSELTEFEQYQLKSAVEALSGTMPELAAAFDETNSTLDLTNDQLEDMFENAGQLAMQQYLIEAQAESYEALAEATLNKAKADSAAARAEDDLNAAMKRIDDSNDSALSKSRQIDVAYQQYEEDMRGIREAQNDAADAIDLANEQIEYQNDAAKMAAESLGLTASTVEEFADGQDAIGDAAGDAADDVTDATEDMEDALYALEDAISDEEQAFYDLRDSIKNSVEDSISFFDEFSGGAEVTAQEVIENLNSQKEGLSQWVENMEELGGQAGTGMSQSLYDKLLEMGPEAANLVQAVVDSLHANDGSFEEISQTWGELLDISNNSEILANASSTGKDIGAEIASGIESSSSDVSKATSTMEKDTKSATDSMQQDTASSSKSMSSDMNSNMNEMQSSVSSSMSSISNTVSSYMNNAVTSVQSGVNRMRSALSVTLRGPNIQVPHFHMSGAFNAQTNSVPTVSVSWYAKGAIFNRPTLIPTIAGVGEAGPEAVLPIDNLKNYISDALDKKGAGNIFNINMTVNGVENGQQLFAEFAQELKQHARIS